MEYTEDDIRDVVLRLIWEDPANNFSVNVPGRDQLPGVRDQRIANEIRFLTASRHIIAAQYGFHLTDKGADIMRAGGWKEYHRKKAADEDLDRRAKEATVAQGTGSKKPSHWEKWVGIGGFIVALLTFLWTVNKDREIDALSVEKAHLREQAAHLTHALDGARDSVQQLSHERDSMIRVDSVRLSNMYHFDDRPLTPSQIADMRRANKATSEKR